MEAGLAQQLIETVERMLEQHRTLLKLAREQQQALVKGDNRKLQTLLPRMEETAQVVTELERSRIAVTEQLAERFGIPSEDATADIFADRLDQRLGSRLRRLTSDLREMVADLMQANEQNAMLTKFSIDYTHKVLGMVAGMPSKDTYGPAKKIQAEARILNLEA